MKFPWDRFDHRRWVLEIVPIVKAASMVENNTGDYCKYLNNVFRDAHTRKEIEQGTIGVRHGRVLE